MTSADTRLPWSVRFGREYSQVSAYPGAGSGDVIQTGLALGIRASEALRQGQQRVGPVRCCLTHSLAHIAVERGTARRWHAPQTLGQVGRAVCEPGGPVYGHCQLLWIAPYGQEYATTDGAALHHTLAVTRSRGRYAA
ncbi:hypothetical protein [Streptacidiphilus sp. EB103A]|uniref:hypothetical protein n=1 Tax=Streptacidiphilus sp. EB103A TaxID=3156275 RepID=UPI0035173EC8